MRCFWVMVVLGLTVCVANAAGTSPKPFSYVKPIGENFVFVQLGDLKAETEVPKPDITAAFAKLRERHPVPGLYTAGVDTKLVWELKDVPYVPYDHCFVTLDGKHLILIEGEFWKTESFSGGRRPAMDVIQKQFNGPAISFHADGKLLKRYIIRDFSESPDNFKHTPEHLIWYASGLLREEPKQFVMFTQDATKFRFDVTTGEIVEKSLVGLSNPIVEKVLIVIAGMTALILAGWGLFAYKRRNPEMVSNTN
ncbi:MAG: hypothetical protein ACRC8S_06525 [Fimbriiglobus sp.]